MSLVNVPVMRRQLGFRISQLFSAGEQGVWYDPSDFSTMFQDAAGTTPVTAVGQPVGLLLDKSKGLALSSELVTNGTFDSNITGWTAGSANSNISWNSGKLRVSTTALNSAGKSAYQAFPVVAGKWYKISGEAILLEGTATVVQVTLRDSATAETSTRIAGTTDSLHTASSGTFYYYADTTRTLYLHCRIFNTTQPCTVDFDNVSAKQIVGNHATQTTDTKRPVLSARYNLNIATEDFTQASWIKGRITAQSNITGPDGGKSACAFYEITDFGAHYIDNGIQTPSGVRTKRSAFLKYSGAQYVLVASNPDIADRNICVDLINNTIAAQGSLVNSASITPYKNGWYFVQFEVTAGQTFTISFRTLQSVSTVSQQFAGNPSRGVMVYRPDTRVANDGIGLPPYQRINTVTDYDTTGFPPYLLFDGIDDALQTANINFTGTDKMTVFAGLSKFNQNITSALAELSQNINFNNGAFFIGAPTSTNSYQFNSKGTSEALAPVPASKYPSPSKNVITCLGDISGDSLSMRVNGIQEAISTADQGTGNYGNYPLYIGSRAGTTQAFNGRLYSLIIRGAQSTATQISNAENYVNSKTGAY